MPHKIWAVGEEVLAADFQTYLQDQVVPQFPNIAARDTWAAPPVGALCVTTDTNTPWMRGGSAWFVVPGTVVAYRENTTESGWTTTNPTVIDLATAPTFYAGNRYGITFDCAWRGSTLNDVHAFVLEVGTGPGGDFTTVATLRQWPIAPARASVSGSSEHFHALYPWAPSSTTTARIRVKGIRLGGSGSATVVLSNLEIAARGIQGVSVTTQPTTRKKAKR